MKLSVKNNRDTKVLLYQPWTDPGPRYHRKETVTLLDHRASLFCYKSLVKWDHSAFSARLFPSGAASNEHFLKSTLFLMQNGFGSAPVPGRVVAATTFCKHSSRTGSGLYPSDNLSFKRPHHSSRWWRDKNARGLKGAPHPEPGAPFCTAVQLGPTSHHDLQRHLEDRPQRKLWEIHGTNGWEVCLQTPDKLTVWFIEEFHVWGIKCIVQTHSLTPCKFCRRWSLSKHVGYFIRILF